MVKPGALWAGLATTIRKDGLDLEGMLESELAFKGENTLIYAFLEFRLSSFQSKGEEEGGG